MIYYRIEMNDGEYVATKNTKDEALDFRNEYQRGFISRYCIVYEICYSKATGFRSEKKNLLD